MFQIQPSRLLTVTGVILATMAIHSPVINAQQLEEIVVTAQRREQSLQEVPISIETYTSAQIRKQGYRDLESLASLVPGIIALPQQDQTVIMIRGFGTSGNALTLEQATPIFLDGIHFGRASQAKNAYLDVERIEILKGPQPVFFGNNATAGAFNIQSKRPTASWEGDVDVEIGNNNTQQISFGVGGPISDTLGIRLAGKYETTDGYLIDAIDEQPYPHQEDKGGRLTLQWTPTENFQATAKAEFGKIDAGSEGKLVCLTGGDLVFGRRGPLSTRTDGTGGSGTEGEPFSVWLNPPNGEGWEQSHLPIPRTDGSCFDSNISRSNEGPYYDVPTNIRQTQAGTGMLDIREVGQAYLNDDSDPLLGPQNAFSSILGGETIDNFNSYLDLTYSLNNGIEANWLTGFSKYNRETSEENFDSPFYENNQIRNINFDQWSTELRFTSPTGGTIEWMAGVFVQDTSLDNVTGNLRATVRRGVRMNNVWEDVRWKTAFATFTFNFLDDKASIDIGGRYADIDKLTFAHGYGSQWIVNEEPGLNAPGDGLLTGSLADYVQADPATDGSRIYLPFDATAGLWYYRFADNRNTPEGWKGTAGANVVGLTAPLFSCLEANCQVRTQGPAGGAGNGGDFGSKEFDPQVVLRYRPNDNHSLWARWAQSFKLGGFDTGQTTIPNNLDDFAFDTERTEAFEVGAKGTLMDGRARYDVTLFQNIFRSLQLQAATGNLDDPNANVNAGKQRVRGVEFSIDYAATERWTVMVAGAIMDGVMVDFFNSPCNRTEVVTAAAGCDLSGTSATNPNFSTIDRSGQGAAFTPDWGFTFDSNYVMPVFDRYELSFNVRGYVSDDYFTDRQDFTKDVAWDQHGDVSINVGFGDAEGTWRVVGWGRNLLEANRSYNPALDFTETNAITPNVSASNFMTYGVKFEYTYR
ncbi:MAG: TonB-dependent receptor [Gammaproteobacteria bacterium]|jgi:outer membrane receptor protein involved in Fe transport